MSPETAQTVDVIRQVLEGHQTALKQALDHIEIQRLKMAGLEFRVHELEGRAFK